MCQSVTIQQLASSYNIVPEKVELYIEQIKNNTDLVTKQEDNKFSLSETAEEYFTEAGNYESDHQQLLNYTLCRQINNLCAQQKTDFTLQLTKRTKLKQQKEQPQFSQLPDLIKLEKKAFAEKILSWLKSKIVLEDLNKVIVDRFSKDNNSDQQPDLRITLYEDNHPQDINLIFKDKLNFLKKISYQELEHKLDTTIDSIIDLQEKLNNTDNEQDIKRFFKSLVGYKDYYKITTDPEIIIIDFSHISLATELKITKEEEDCLLLDFNNNCQISICSGKEDKTFITKLKKEPQEMELFSL
ncbi:MAG: hypothetical protein ACQEP9_08340 [Bacillota bacterium]